MTQAILLRLITRQAGGGEIIRIRHVDGPVAKIGRSHDCDIYLPDLAVEHQHAMLRLLGPNRVSVEAVGGRPFAINRTATLSTVIDAERGAVIGFGGYDLRVGLGPENEILVMVARREAEVTQGAALFSLKATVFGRRRTAWTLGLAILALCLVLPLAGASYVSHLRIHPDRQWSSGPLSTSHAFLETDCQACHQKAFVAVRDEACLACHSSAETAPDALRLDAQLRAQGSPFAPLRVGDHAAQARLLRATPLPDSLPGKASALVGRALNHPNDRCASCHLEHKAPVAADRSKSSPARQERPTLAVTQDCAACHAKLKMRLADTTLIDTPDWGRHPPFRPLVTQAPGPQPRLQRIALTSAPQERTGLAFSHRQHLDATGGVARMGQRLGAARGYDGALTCQSCHRATADKAAWQPIEMERDCAACHTLVFAARGGQAKSLPHGDVRKVMTALTDFYASGGPARQVSGETGRRLPGDFRPQPRAGTAVSSGAPGAFRAAFSPGGACYGCHAIRWTGDGPMGVAVAPVHLTQRFLPRGAFDHATPAHRGEGAGAAKCADCHKAATSDRSADVLLPDIGKCAGCHGQPKAKVVAAASADCAECHAYHQPGASSPPAVGPLRAARLDPIPGSGQ